MIKLNQDAYGRIFKELMQGPCTSYELQDVCGLALVTIQDLMKCLQKYEVVHRSAWEINKRGIDTTPVYSWGSGINKKRRCATQAERAKKHRDKKKAIKQANLLHTG